MASPVDSGASRHIVLIKQYGVILLKQALNESEQIALLKEIKKTGNVKEMKPSGNLNFYISSGTSGSSTTSGGTSANSSQHKPQFHELGELLFTRCGEFVKEKVSSANASVASPSASTEPVVASSTADASVAKNMIILQDAGEGIESTMGEVQNEPSLKRLLQEVAGEGIELTMEEVQNEPSLKRLLQAATNEKPVKVNTITGVAYSPSSELKNHCDLDKPLYTMSVALGDSCDFTIGQKTIKPMKNERSGKPVKMRMESGDAMFFDGGSVPHAVDGVCKDTAPEFWKKAGLPKNYARVSVLFREAIA